MKNYQRIFLIVMDSLGIGEMPDAKLFGDEGANTLLHIGERCKGLSIPTLNSLGIHDICEVEGSFSVSHPHSYVSIIKEQSNGKDTMTGHWEMMGVLTTKPFLTFTENGFPKELIEELETRTGRKVIGNIAASGTEIIKQLGEQHMKTGDLIVYTSADSVLQIAAHEEIVPVKELYRYCEIAREICMKPEYMVGRIIARPFIGNDANSFKRTSNRHDIALSPTHYTYMELLKDHGYDVKCIGKIGDIFNGVGVTTTSKTKSNQDGMDQTIEIAKNENFNGLCFVNLVEFDSEYGHRRNPIGYGKAIEEFDVRLKELIDVLRNDDLLIVTADHGNDPTMKGSDHTREMVPLIAYSKKIEDGCKLDDRFSFADLGRTIIANFNLLPEEGQIGSVIEDLL